MVRSALTVPEKAEDLAGIPGGCVAAVDQSDAGTHDGGAADARGGDRRAPTAGAADGCSLYQVILAEGDMTLEPQMGFPRAAVVAIARRDSNPPKSGWVTQHRARRYRRSHSPTAPLRRSPVHSLLPCPAGGPRSLRDEYAWKPGATFCKLLSPLSTSH